MAAQQILVLFVLVRIQVEQRKAVSNVRWSGFSVLCPSENSGERKFLFFEGSKTPNLVRFFIFYM